MKNPLAFAVSNIKLGQLYRQERIRVPRTLKVFKLVRILLLEGVLLKQFCDWNKIRVLLRFVGTCPLIKNMVFISKPGRRIYMSNIQFQRLFLKKRGALVFFIVSFSLGWATSNELVFLSKNKRLGGEVLLQVIINGNVDSSDSLKHVRINSRNWRNFKPKKFKKKGYWNVDAEKAERSGVEQSWITAREISYRRWWRY